MKTPAPRAYNARMPNGTTGRVAQAVTIATATVAAATVTETALLRGRVDELEKQVAELLEKYERTRKQLLALRDGAWLRE